MSYKQRMSIVLLILSNINMYYCCKPNCIDSVRYDTLHSPAARPSYDNVAKVTQSSQASPSLSPHSASGTVDSLPEFYTPRSNASVASGLSYQADIGDEASFADVPQTHIYISYSYNHDYEVRDVYVHIVGKRFNEKVGYDDLYCWECKVDKLLSMMHHGYLDIDEDDIDEIRRNAPELYERYKRQFEEYMERKMDQPLLFSESGFVLYIPEEIARGENKVGKKQEEVIHLTSDPKLFDRVFKVVPIRERPKVSEASRIRREKQEAEYREQQRIHAEEYKAKERALRRANGEDMIFDPRVGKKVHFEDYLRSLFLSQLAETRACAR